MEAALILAGKVFVFFLLIGTGIICERTGLLDGKTARKICDMVLHIIIPVVVLYSFIGHGGREMLGIFWIALLLVVLIHLLFIALVTVLCPRREGAGENYRVRRLAAAYANSGFMGIPLLMVLVGDVGNVFAAAYIGVQMVCNWTWGSYCAGEPGGFSLKKFLLNPTILCFFVGLFLFVSGFKLPSLLLDYTGYLFAVNTPISCIAVGVFLARIPIREILGDRSVLYTVLLRNLLLPGAVFLLFWAFRVPSWHPLGGTMALCLLVMSGCPSAATAILMTARCGLDSRYGSKLVAATTFSSILTLPLLAFLAQLWLS